MSSRDKQSIIERIQFLSASNSVGATIQAVFLIAAMCAAFSTFFWWIR